MESESDLNNQPPVLILLPQKNCNEASEQETKKIDSAFLVK
jgi:hypothetical protein